MEREGIVYGYARVSAKDQKLRRQIDALTGFPVAEERIYADKASGKDFERPAWRRLMGELRPGDVLVVKSIDRLGRDYAEILDVWRDVTKARGVAIVVLDMPVLDTRKECDGITGVLIADIVLQLLSYVAQIERENIRQRQAEGIAAAKARGVSFGRPRKKRPANYQETREAFWGGRITRKEAAARCKVSETTFARWAREDERCLGESS